MAGIILKITERGMVGIERSIRHLEKRTHRAVSHAVGKMAHYLRKEIVTGIRSQAPGGIQFKPLKPATIKRKRSTKALINHGDLIRSINVTKMSDFVYFVGVHRMTSARIGSITLVNLAEIHEFGSKKRPGRPPARPFLIPSYKAWRYGAEKEFATLVGRELGFPVALGIDRGVGSIAGKISFGGDVTVGEG